MKVIPTKTIYTRYYITKNRGDKIEKIPIWQQALALHAKKQIREKQKED